MKLPQPLIRLSVLALSCVSFGPPAWGGLTNAWQIRDNSIELGGALSYTNYLTATNHQAATNGGFIYSVRARFVEDRGIVTMAMAYGLGNRRFQIGFDLNAHGDLVATPVGGASYTLTTGGTGTNLYHTHSIQFNPTNGTASYLVDGVTIINNWPASAPPLAARQVYWGGGQLRWSRHHEFSPGHV